MSGRAATVTERVPPWNTRSLTLAARSILTFDRTGRPRCALWICRDSPLGARFERASLREAFPAKYGATLGWPERHGRGYPALRADRRGFHAAGSVRAGPRRRAAPLLTLLATLGLVAEILVREKKLLTGGENKFRTAVDAGQCLVGEFGHVVCNPGVGQLPLRRT